MTETVTVRASRAYDVTIGGGLLPKLGECAVSAVYGASRALLSMDDNTAALYGKTAEESLERAGLAVSRFIIPHGETSKNAANFIRLMNFAAENGFDRSDMFVALGGGVVGDLTGFAAASYMRGVRFIQAPTTLLAVVDSSVGGKTAIDLDAGKNMAGAFYQPDAVLCDTNTLKTLPRDIYTDGLAEVIKYGAICAPDILDSLGGEYDIGRLISRCVGIKADIVARDEFDKGERRLLNFGHTVGHAVERLSGYAIPHGRAVAIGMSTIARASARAGICDTETADRLCGLIEDVGLPTACEYSADELFSAALSDKKCSGGSITLILPTAWGRCSLQRMTHAEFRRLISCGME